MQHLKTQKSSQKLLLYSLWQQPGARLCIRIVSLLITLTFVFPYLTWAFDKQTFLTGLSGILFNQQAVDIPKKLGTITQSFQGKEKMVMHIQDLHCNHEVQMNIARMIDHFSRCFELNLVAVEGADSRVNVSKLSSFPVKSVKEEVGNYFVKQGKVTGAEYITALSQRPLQLVGIENPEYYTASREHVRRFLNDESQGYVFDLRDALQGIKPVIYSQTLSKHDQHRTEFLEGRKSLLTYAVFLYKTGLKSGLDMQTFPQLRRYVSKRMNLFSLEVDSDQLYVEMERLENTLREALYGNDTEQELDALLHRLEVIEKLISISATPEELDEYRKYKTLFRVDHFVEFITRHDQMGEYKTDVEVYRLDSYLREVGAFYRIADARSLAFVENTVQCMQKNKVSLIVLVTGGFHSSVVLEELQKQNISYVSIKPRLTRLDTVNPYFALLRNRTTALEKLLAQNQDILALPTNFSMRTFLNLLDVTLKQGLISNLLQKGIHELDEVQTEFVKMLSKYLDNNTKIALDWENAVASRSRQTYSLPMRNMGFTIVIRRQGRKIPGHTVATWQLNDQFEVAIFDDLTAREMQTAVLTEGTDLLRGETVSLALLNSPLAALIAGSSAAVLLGSKEVATTVQNNLGALSPVQALLTRLANLSNTLQVLSRAFIRELSIAVLSAGALLGKTGEATLDRMLNTAAAALGIVLNPGQAVRQLAQTSPRMMRVVLQNLFRQQLVRSHTLDTSDPTRGPPIRKQLAAYLVKAQQQAEFSLGFLPSINSRELPIEILKREQIPTDVQLDVDIENLGVFHYQGKVYLTEKALRNLNNKEAAAVILHEALENAGFTHDQALRITRQATGFNNNQLVARAGLKTELQLTGGHGWIQRAAQAADTQPLPAAAKTANEISFNMIIGEVLAHALDFLAMPVALVRQSKAGIMLINLLFFIVVLAVVAAYFAVLNVPIELAAAAFIMLFVFLNVLLIFRLSPLKRMRPRKVGIVCTMMGGLDGVGLELEKITHVLRRAGHEVVGLSARGSAFNTFTEFVPNAASDNVVNQFILAQALPDFPPEKKFKYLREAWEKKKTDPDFDTAQYIRQFIPGHELLSKDNVEAAEVLLERESERIKQKILEITDQHGLDSLVLENTNTMPSQFPLALAIRKAAEERPDIHFINHNHNFYMERRWAKKRAPFIQPYLDSCFPLELPNVTNNVISSFATSLLHSHCGMKAFKIWPNVMDYKKKPHKVSKAFVRDFSYRLGLRQDDIPVVLPVRIVERKSIEIAVQMIKAMRDKRYKLIITGFEIDTDQRYKQSVKDFIAELGVEDQVIFMEDQEKASMGTAAGMAGEKRQVTLDEIYGFTKARGGFAVYPSTKEGFGNALLEMVHAELPVVLFPYMVYQMDIQPKGFDFIHFPYIPDSDQISSQDLQVALREGNLQKAMDRVAAQIKQRFSNPQEVRRMVHKNRMIAAREYSYETLDALLAESMQLMPARKISEHRQVVRLSDQPGFVPLMPYGKYLAAPVQQIPELLRSKEEHRVVKGNISIDIQQNELAPIQMATYVSQLLEMLRNSNKRIARAAWQTLDSVRRNLHNALKVKEQLIKYQDLNQLRVKTAPGRLTRIHEFLTDFPDTRALLERGAVINDIGMGRPHPVNPAELAVAMRRINPDNQVVGADILIPKYVMQDTLFNKFAYFDEQGNVVDVYDYQGMPITTEEEKRKFQEYFGKYQRGEIAADNKRHPVQTDPYRSYAHLYGFDMKLASYGEGIQADIKTCFIADYMYPGKKPLLIRQMARDLKPKGFLLVGNSPSNYFGANAFVLYQKKQGQVLAPGIFLLINGNQYEFPLQGGNQSVEQAEELFREIWEQEDPEAAAEESTLLTRYGLIPEDVKVTRLAPRQKIMLQPSRKYMFAPGIKTGQQQLLIRLIEKDRILQRAIEKSLGANQQISQTGPAVAVAFCGKGTFKHTYRVQVPVTLSDGIRFTADVAVKIPRPVIGLLALRQPKIWQAWLRGHPNLAEHHLVHKGIIVEDYIRGTRFDNYQPHDLINGVPANRLAISTYMYILEYLKQKSGTCHWFIFNPKPENIIQPQNVTEAPKLIDRDGLVATVFPATPYTCLVYFASFYGQRRLRITRFFFGVFAPLILLFTPIFAYVVRPDRAFFDGILDALGPVEGRRYLEKARNSLGNLISFGSLFRRALAQYLDGEVDDYIAPEKLRVVKRKTRTVETPAPKAGEQGRMGRWPWMQGMYDRIETAVLGKAAKPNAFRRGLGWFTGQVIAPMLVESGLFVGVFTLGGQFLLSWAFGLPFALRPPFWVLFGVFQLAWHGLHLPVTEGGLTTREFLREWVRSAFTPAILEITGLTTAALIGVQILSNPGGLLFAAIFLPILLSAHLIVNLQGKLHEYWHAILEPAPEQELARTMRIQEIMKTMDSTQRLLPAGIRPNQALRTQLSVPQRVVTSSMQALLYLTDRQLAGRWRTRLPVDGMVSVLRVIIILAMLPLAFWFNRKPAIAAAMSEEQVQQIVRDVHPDATAMELFVQQGAGDALQPNIEVKSLSEFKGSFFQRMRSLLGRSETNVQGNPVIYVPTGLLYQTSPFQGFFLRLIMEYQIKRFYAQNRLNFIRAGIGIQASLAARITNGVGLITKPGEHIGLLLAERNSGLALHLSGAVSSRVTAAYQTWLENPNADNSAAWLNTMIDLIRSQRDMQNMEASLYTLSELSRRIPMLNGRKIGKWTQSGQTAALPGMLWEPKNRLKLKMLLNRLNRMPLQLEQKWLPPIRRPRRFPGQAA
ncbi:hypothetical protein KAR34_08635 [bacterium]|nr:hypothetical protein [bacterium]